MPPRPLNTPLIYEHIHMYTDTYTHTCTHIHVHTCIYIHVHTHAHMRAHTHTYKHTHTRTHTYDTYTCRHTCTHTHTDTYSRSHGKIAITVQRSPLEQRSAFTVHGNDVHRFLAIRQAGQPFSEQTVSDMIGTPLLKSQRLLNFTQQSDRRLPGGAGRKQRFEKAADWLNG